MAETATAPIKNKKSAFGPKKEADVILFKLLNTNAKERPDTPLYPPVVMFPARDVIEWDGGERAIRYLSGWNTIFVDEQEANGRIIPDSVLNNTKNIIEFNEGEVKVRPHEKTKLQFLRFCNRNADSPHRTGKVPPLYSEYSEEKKTNELQLRQARQREALEKAFTAKESQIAFHAQYLGISPIDPATSATRTIEAIRADYQQFAIDNPDGFLRTFNDDDLKLKYYIQQAIDENVLSLNIKAGYLVWAANKEDLCEVQPGSTPIESAFNYMQLPLGDAAKRKVLELNK